MRMRIALAVILSLATAALLAACDDSKVGKVLPRASLQQDWNGDSVLEALPADPTQAADYLIDFGKVVVKQRASRAIVIRNLDVAQAKLLITAVRLENASADFILDPPMLTELEPGQATTFAVLYVPQEDGADSGQVVVETNDPDHKIMTLRLVGEGVTPDVQVCLVEGGVEVCNDQVAPANLKIDFGMNDLGDLVSREFLVRNLGVYELTVQAGGGRGGVDLAPGASSEFAIEPRAWSGVLQPQSTQRFTAKYAPFDGGTDNARIEIASNDPDEGLVAIEIVGNGLAPKICPQPPFIVDFGTVMVGSTTDKTYRFTSCGNQTLTITTLAIDSGNHGFFTFAASQGTPFDLAPGASFDVQMRFKPTYEGAFAGKLTIRSNDPNSGEGYIDLVGKAVPTPMCELVALPATLDFGQVSTSGFATKPLTLRNQGTKECQVTGMTGPTGSAAFTVP
ncbi:MAG: choice-of-anchor D domain-containing protein, partial [Myxococcales bacterium]|nr:choice-of-anchor D domain-containing protein [Myxococcales bacterium]